MNGTLFQLFRIAARYARLQFRAEPELNSPHYNPPSGGGGPSTLAVITAVCGVLTWTLVPFLAGIVGCITGWIELGNIKKGQSPEDGKLITQLGLAASAASVLLSCVGGCLAGAAYFGLVGLLLGGAAVSTSGGAAPN